MTRLQANAVLLLAALIWGSSFVVQQIGTGELGSITFTGSRFLLGAFVIAPLALRQLRKMAAVQPLRQSDWLWMALTGCVLMTAAGLQQYGILHTTVTNSGFLTGLYVPMVPLLGLLFFRRRVSFFIWPAAAGCLCGTWLLSGGHQLDGFASGDLWVIASAFFWAGHVLLVGHVAQRTGAPLVLALVQFFVCGIVGLLVGGIVEQPSIMAFAGAWQGIAWMGIMSVGIAFTLQVVAQRWSPAADAAILLSSESVFAALGGAIFLGERMAVVQFCGAVLIFVCILAVELLPLLRRKQVLE
jgi:drug/metabolite transporter (DMT)-like permease